MLLSLLLKLYVSSTCLRNVERHVQTESPIVVWYMCDLLIGRASWRCSSCFLSKQNLPFLRKLQNIWNSCFMHSPLLVSLCKGMKKLLSRPKFKARSPEFLHLVLNTQQYSSSFYYSGRHSLLKSSLMPPRALEYVMTWGWLSTQKRLIFMVFILNNR